MRTASLDGYSAQTSSSNVLLMLKIFWPNETGIDFNNLID